MPRLDVIGERSRLGLGVSSMSECSSVVSNDLFAESVSSGAT